MRKLLLASLLLVLSILGASAVHAQNTMVRFHTTAGPIDMKLLNSEAPITVANFLAYVRGGDYINVFFHRSAWLNSTTPFVIQTGGHKWPDSGCCPSVTSRGAIPNEFSPSRSNVRGTVAMAKLGNDPNSATSQWFVNMSDNSANLDAQNGGFTVFARLTNPSLELADAIARLPRVSTTQFPELPVMGQIGSQITRNNVVLITEVTEFPANPGPSDRIFNFLEAKFPQYLAPSKGQPMMVGEYYVRYYSATGSYLGTRGNTVYYLVPALGGQVSELGDLNFWLSIAAGSGY